MQLAATDKNPINNQHHHHLQNILIFLDAKQAKKPLINEQIKKQCLAFAKKYKHCTNEQGRKVMFFEEEFPSF